MSKSSATRRPRPAVGFLQCTVAHFASFGIRVERLMTDKGNAYRSTIHALACKALGIKHLRTRPYWPRTNGKAERFIRTLLGGWAYGAIYRSSEERAEHSAAGSTTTLADDPTAASAAKPRSNAYTRSTGTTSSGPTACIYPRVGPDVPVPASFALDSGKEGSYLHTLNLLAKESAACASLLP
jgi:hypothetical protein